MKTAVVAGALANKPGNAGEAWVRMSWARGLVRLGFDVWFVEMLDGGPESASRGPVRFFDRVTRANGFGDRRALWVDGELWGAGVEQWDELGDRCELLVNISGHLPPDPWFDRVQRRVYVDLDPGYTQVWAAQGLLGDTLARHTDHYTVGLNVGTDRSPLPSGGVAWRPTLQPVVLDAWPALERQAVEPDRDASGSLRFTTIASWRGAFGPLELDGLTYGVKAHEWRRFRGLPARAPGHRFEAALAIHEADGNDREALERARWRLEDPASCAGTQSAFRDYVTGSDAEFSVAQGAYVDTDSGWFSDRSARYLASGRPVLVQDTGFGAVLPEGEGVIAFDSLDGAVEGVQRIASDYARHARAARDIAESWLDSDVVLGRMLSDLDLEP